MVPHLCRIVPHRCQVVPHSFLGKPLIEQTYSVADRYVAEQKQVFGFRFSVFGAKG
jgi:hypothetical protein